MEGGKDRGREGRTQKEGRRGRDEEEEAIDQTDGDIERDGRMEGDGRTEAGTDGEGGKNEHAVGRSDGGTCLGRRKERGANGGGTDEGRR